MEPDFASMLFGAVLFSLLVLEFIWWRFGLPDMLVFIIVVGLFSAIIDFISSFVVRNYEYPGQSPLWVFTYIFLGWMGMCGSCLFIAEGILANPGEDMLSQHGLWWRVPLLTAVLAVVFDLFIDPVAVAAVLGLVQAWAHLLRHSSFKLCRLVCIDVFCTSGVDFDCEKTAMGELPQGRYCLRLFSSSFYCFGCDFAIA